MCTLFVFCVECNTFLNELFCTYLIWCEFCSLSFNKIAFTGIMMECQSTECGSCQDIIESLSDETLNPDSGDNSALSSEIKQSCFEQVPAVLPCSQTEQLSVSGCHVDLQQMNEAQAIVSYCDSKQQPPEHFTDANRQLEQIYDGQNLQFKGHTQLLGHGSENHSVQVSTSAILDRGADVGDEKLQETSHHSHLCDNQLINTSLPVNSNNNVSMSDNVKQGLALMSDKINPKTSNLLCRKSQEQCSDDEFGHGEVDCNNKPHEDVALNECHVHSKQLHQQQIDDADDDIVQQLLQEIDSFSHSQELCSSDQTLKHHHSNILQKLENEEDDKLTEHHINEKLLLPQDNHNNQSRLLDGSNSKCEPLDGGTSETDFSSHKTSNDGVTVCPAEQVFRDQLTSTYNILLNKYLLLRQQRTEQLAIQKQMEEDNQAISIRLASVMVERDRYLMKLNEFEDFSLTDLEEAKQLELTIEEQKQQIQVLKERLAAQENASKQAVMSTQVELKAQIEQMHKKFEDSEKDKQSMVMKYAQAEQKNIELQEKMSKMDGWMKDWSRQRDNLMGRLNATAAEKQKLTQLLEGRASELVSLKREVERQKELVSSQDMKAKWHQNKLKVELESHKETKSKLEEVQQKLKESKEECDKIRQESQSVIKTYQMSQVMDSITKELQLKETEEELINQRMEQTEQKEVFQMVKQELDSLKMKEKDLIEELNTYKDKVKCFETERILQEETLAKFKDTLQNQKRLNRDMTEQVAELESLRPEINELRQQLTEARKEIEERKQANNDLMSDMDSYVNQESEHLNFSQKLSVETVRLQSENLALGDEIASLTSERESMKASMFCLSSKCQALEIDLEKLALTKRQLCEELEKQLKEQTSRAEQFAKQLDDREDELKTLKRRHVSSTKDLRRQLSQLQKRLEQYESKVTNSASSTLSRTSSSGSLDSGSTLGNPKEANPSPQANSSKISSISDIDKEVLIDKIVRLQKSQARKNEKIEFMQDHIDQLLEEVKKKSRIIQNYIMREESYSLAPSEALKQAKMAAAKKGGIVTSMFVSSETGRDVCEDLVEHNSRLQTVLEDKVIHNLTLKHTVETLGQEISHLSNENRKLQLELQQLQNKLMNCLPVNVNQD